MSPLPRQSGSLNITIPDLGKKVEVWRRLAPKAFEEGLHAGIKAITIDVSAEVKNLIDGPVLNRRTGRLWRSIQPETYKRAGTIVGIVGTDVEYAAIHEFGGTIRPKKASGYLVFKVGEGMRRVKEVQMPKRPYMSKALKNRRARANVLIRENIMRSLKGTLRSGRVARVAERKGVGFNAD